MPHLNTSMTLLVAACLVYVLASVAAAQEAHSWAYSGTTGPDHWSEVSAVCGFGRVQSPIDIAKPRHSKLGAIHFSYRASPLVVIDNGHTIQVNYVQGSYLMWEGRTFELKQFHFHHQSETTINGEHAPMELHLVHQDNKGNLLVLAVMLREGDANSTIGRVWNNIGAKQGEANAPSGASIDATQLLPGEHNYYTFPGSLTTPPCTENVTWVVLTEPVTVSEEQVEVFAKLYPGNARPVQPLNGRKVLVSK